MAKEEARELKQSFPRELLEQPSSARLDYFKAYTVAHPFLEQSDEKIRSALREPGGALLIFIIGPTGVGKTTLLTFIEQRLLKLAQAQLSHDPDYVPVIKLDAGTPPLGGGQFELLFQSLDSALDSPYSITDEFRRSLSCGERFLSIHVGVDECFFHSV
jgi:Cdc6-like AAA superfamily ATPase